MRCLRLLAAVATFIVAPVFASASVVVEVGGESWKVSLLTGSYNDNLALLQSQTWWGGDGTRAAEFAEVIDDKLGEFGITGPGFAYRDDPTWVYSKFWAPQFGVPLNGQTERTVSSFYAIAEEVAAIPLPATLPLALGGLGLFAFGRRMRRRAS